MNKASDPPQTPVFPKTLHRLRAGPAEVSSTPMTQRRDNIFSKSRDTREDRGERQMKTSPMENLSHEVFVLLLSKAK